jgi:hypothetical protein
MIAAGKREKAIEEAFAIGQVAKVGFACAFVGKCLAVAKRSFLQYEVDNWPCYP